nr:replication-associated protein [Chicken proventriculitis-associated circular virus 12]
MTEEKKITLADCEEYAELKILTVYDILVDLHNKMLKEKVLKALNEGDCSFLEGDNIVINKSIVRPLINYYGTLKNKDTKKPIHSRQHICFITITKSDAVNVSDYITMCHKLKDLKITEDSYYYAFEATKYENNEFGNIHCHYLCKKQVSINHASYLKRIEKHFGQTAFNVNLQIYTEDYYDDKIAYLNGDKEKEQEDKPEITKQFRTTYNLDNLYTTCDTVSIKPKSKIQLKKNKKL